MAQAIRAEPIALLADRIGETERVIVHTVPKGTRVFQTDSRYGTERVVLSTCVVVT